MTVPFIQVHHRKWLILIAISLGMMLGVFNVALVNITVPTLVRDLNSTVAGVFWVLNAFNITPGCSAALIRQACRPFGATPSLPNIGVGVHHLFVRPRFCAKCRSADCLSHLAGDRIGGDGAGFAGYPSGGIPVASTWVGDRAMGRPGPGGGHTGSSCGRGSHRIRLVALDIFMNVPVGVVAFVMAFLFVPETQRDTKSLGLDLPGVGLSAATLSCLTVAIMQGNTWGCTRPWSY